MLRLTIHINARLLGARDRRRAARSEREHYARLERILRAPIKPAAWTRAGGYIDPIGHPFAEERKP